ncbi:hypothetical protein V6N13_033986 [Hibiscus sabdariffa]
MFMNLRILSWNVQGCGDPHFITAAKQFLRDYKPNVILFVKPRISGRRANSVIAALGFPNSHHIEAAGFSSGIWLAWYNSVKVDIILNHFQFFHLRVTTIQDGSSVYATAVYASP